MKRTPNEIYQEIHLLRLCRRRSICRLAIPTPCLLAAVVTRSGDLALIAPSMYPCRHFTRPSTLTVDNWVAPNLHNIAVNHHRANARVGLICQMQSRHSEICIDFLVSGVFMPPSQDPPSTFISNMLMNIPSFHMLHICGKVGHQLSLER
ncbi:hypothetical protein F4821DRAFT_132548 [Hypoxylon rubiginosum]|uniref:Uncharacterized protein n=1 Tax=Hypoxylon rubiginosum TaxID=110542 RepID=A0ACC0D0A2_9PEZI|nr:hypothetical protein F4821DRAFT_132548 [Hypoxylon rubiginosum]